MASLYKNKDTWYISVYAHGKRSTRSLSTKDKNVAKELKPFFESQIIRELTGIDDGSIIGLYVLGGNPKLDITDDLREKFKKLEFLVVHDVSQTNLAEIADIVFPTTIPFEKTGSMTNSQGRVQLLNPAFPQPCSARDDIIVLKSVGERLGIDIGPTNPDIIFEEIGAKVEEYTGLTYSMIGEKGAIKGNVDTSINNVRGE